MRYKLVIGLIVTLIVTAFTMAENDFAQQLIKKLQQFKQKSPQVKLFLAFNQTTYMPGDTAYFSIRFLSEDMLPVAGRQVLRVELVDQNGKLSYFQHVSVKDGTGSNQVIIPTDLKSGVYQWIAFSDWMKNFNEQFYFKQNIVIVEKNDLVAKVSDDNLLIRFFPEGGNMVTSVSNKVVAQCNKYISSTRIMDEGGNEVTRADFNKNGFAQFTLTPKPGSRYYAESEYQGKLVRFSLPEGLRDGLAMELMFEQTTARLKVSVLGDSKLKSENIWMVVSSRSEIYFTAPLNFENKEWLSLAFPFKDLPQGICYVTLLNEQGNVLAERLFAVENGPQINASIEKGKASFNTRSRVNFQIRLRDELQNPLAGEFSISVVNKKFINKWVPPVPIRDYLLFNSDLVNGNLPQSRSGLDQDIFLITQKNNRIDWNAVWKEKSNQVHTFKWMIEYSGKALDKQTNQPVPDSSLVLVYLQKNLMGYEAVTRKDGSFDLPFILDFWNEDEVFYTVQDKRGREVVSDIQWQVDSSAYERVPLHLTEGESMNAYANFQVQNRLIKRSYEFYHAGSASAKELPTDDPNFSFEDELSGADFTIQVNDYVVFPSMEELIREVIPNLQHRKVKGKPTVRVLLPNVGAAPDGPLYIIDGIMTRDTDYFLKFKTSDIISIKVVKTFNKLRQMGPMAKNGVVLVRTKGLNHDVLKRNNTMMPVKGINRQIPFQVIDHSKTASARVPDFRSTLYWNPSLKADARGISQINFSASDDVGTFLIYVQGMTSDGRPFAIVDSLSVNYNHY